MEYLTMHGNDGEERYFTAFAGNDSFHDAGNLFLGDAWAYGLHGCCMHFVTDGHRTLDFCDFLIGLDGTHVDNSFDESDGCCIAYFEWMDAE